MYDLQSDTDLPLVLFTNEYVEGILSSPECLAFEEYLSKNAYLARFVQCSLKGKRALTNAFSVKAADDFEEKLARRISEEKERADYSTA